MNFFEFFLPLETSTAPNLLVVPPKLTTRLDRIAAALRKGSGESSIEAEHMTDLCAAQSEEEYDGIIPDTCGSGPKLGNQELLEKVKKIREKYPAFVLAPHEAVVKKGKRAKSLERQQVMRESREGPESRSGLELAHLRHLGPKGQGTVKVDSGRDCNCNRVSPRYCRLESAKKLLRSTKRFGKAYEDEGTSAACVAAGKAMSGKVKRQRQRRGKPRLNRLDPCKTSELKSGVSRPSLSGNKTSNVLFRHEWGGWGAIFNAIVLFHQFATFLCKSIVNAFSQWQSRQRWVPTVDGRSPREASSRTD